MKKKLKRFYKQNRIYCILMIVSIFCFILMGSAVVIYFISQATSSPYGRRLDNIDKYKVTEELKNIEKYYKELEEVTDIKVNLQAKIIYIEATVLDKVTNDQIQNIATASLDSLTEEQKGYYDIQFIFSRDSYVPYFGSKSSSNSTITWVKYNFDHTDSEKE